MNKLAKVFSQLLDVFNTLIMLYYLDIYRSWIIQNSVIINVKLDIFPILDIYPASWRSTLSVYRGKVCCRENETLTLERLTILSLQTS